MVMVPLSRHIASARTQRTIRSRVSLLSSHSPVHPHRLSPVVVSRTIEMHPPSAVMTLDSEIAEPAASIMQPNATQSMGSLQPSDATSRRNVYKKPVPRYPPGIPIHNAAQSTGFPQPSNATSQQAAGQKEVPRYPPGIPIRHVMRGMGSLQPSDAMSRQEAEKKPIPRYPPGIPIPANRRGHHRQESMKFSSANSWSSKTVTTENNLSQRVPLSVDTHNFSDGAFIARSSAPAEPSFHTGTILNSVWVDTPRVGLQHTTHTTTGLLEPFRNGGDILNPAWVNNPCVGQGQVAGAHAHLLEAFRLDPTRDPAYAGGLCRWGDRAAPRGVPPKSPIYEYGQSDEYDWAVAVSTYDHLHLEDTRFAMDFLDMWKYESEVFRELNEKWVREALVADERPEEEPILLKEIHFDGSTGLLLAMAGDATADGRSGGTSSSEFPSLPVLDDIIPGLVGLGETFEEERRG
ncbi:uncharacterized protein C8Q71DRAFT_496659 [Rhodofomes roseus]|uniref:Uncharacterized protein n=1 Tax=Rhodofomes roseus TaxID=34475 RepID=A0ABQ8KLC9_9APHY|nr:uncharacterized protein C8Q71DRAFT_496659 [Rhodofomes roseus]KAH9839112.1 hypothetical protein C8Q71DRAFT_496659 [Rhodofomes roseus]